MFNIEPITSVPRGDDVLSNGAWWLAQKTKSVSTRFEFLEISDNNAQGRPVQREQTKPNYVRYVR